MHNENWWQSLQFPLAASLAGLLFAAAMLAPLYVRNERMRQSCHEQQWELLDLESQNLQRARFIEAVANEPQLIAWLNRGQQPTEEAGLQQIQIPYDLAIHPDVMLQADASAEPLTFPDAASPEQAGPTLLLETASHIADSPQTSRGLMIAAVLILISGTVSLRGLAQTTKTEVTGRLWSTFRRRYLHHAAHRKPNPPHVGRVKTKPRKKAGRYTM